MAAALQCFCYSHCRRQLIIAMFDCIFTICLIISHFSVFDQNLLLFTSQLLRFTVIANIFWWSPRVHYNRVRLCMIWKWKLNQNSIYENGFSHFVCWHFCRFFYDSRTWSTHRRNPPATTEPNLYPTTWIVFPGWGKMCNLKYHTNVA